MIYVSEHALNSTDTQDVERNRYDEVAARRE
jgi:hypothetical protein